MNTPLVRPADDLPYGDPEPDAGRVLDALIAEKVVGFHREGQPADYDGRYKGEPVLLPSGQTIQSLYQSGYDLPPKGLIALTFFVPHYSTDLADAWLVIEKLNEKYHARVKSPFTPGEKYFAGFTPHGATGWNGRPDYEGSGETAPLAICRAALKAANAAPAEPCR